MNLIVSTLVIGIQWTLGWWIGTIANYFPLIALEIKSVDIVTCIVQGHLPFYNKFCPLSFALTLIESADLTVLSD